MARMGSGRRVWLPIAMSAVMLALTVSLGFWQLQRRSWKLGLLAEIETGEAGPAVPLSGDTGPFRVVSVEGSFLPGTVRYSTEVRSGADGPVMGSQVIAALSRPGGDPVIVERGWAPSDATVAMPTGTVSIRGYVRPPEHTPRFGAADDPAGHRFYALDPEAIGRSLGLARVLPLTVVALGPPAGQVVPATALPRPPNDHLTYAVTWFGLSAALLVVLIVYLRQQRSSEPRL